MYIYKNVVAVSEEIARYDYIFKQLLLVHEEYHSLLDEPDKCNDDEWFEEVDERVSTFKHKVHNWLNDAEVEQGYSSRRSSKIGSKSASSGSSRRTKSSSSKFSRERAKEEKAKLAEIMAEAEFLEKRQLVENQAEWLKIQEKLAKAKVRSKVYLTTQDHIFVKNEVATNEEFKRDQAASNTTITAGVHRQILKPQIDQSIDKGEIDASNTLKSRTIKSSSKKSCDRTSCAADSQKKIALLPNAKDFDGEMSRMLCSLLRQQSAPDVDIRIFRGDLLEYHFFMSSFREDVERKIDDPHGRLGRLLKFTDGEAKETSRHCIQQPSEIGCRPAKSLLEDHYGNPHPILAAYQKEINSWTPLKPGDLAAYRKLYNFLIKRDSIMSRQQWNSLDTPDVLCSLVSKLPGNKRDR